MENEKHKYLKPKTLATYLRQTKGNKRIETKANQWTT